MNKYISTGKLCRFLDQHSHLSKGKLLGFIRAEAEEVIEVKHRNPDDENCVICNSELDEKCANGIWDLAGEICSIICPECEHEEQDTIYNLIRNYLEAQNFCPACGAKMDGKDI